MRTSEAHCEQRIVGPGLKVFGTAVALLLGVGWSATTLAATSPVVNCHSIDQELQTLDAETTRLSVNLVDLPENGSEIGLIETIDKEPGESVPHLYLAPRVTSMLREVFEENEPVDRDWDLVKPNDDGVKRDASLPPVAGGNTKQKTMPALDDDDLAKESDQSMPRFQRAMYRTDI